MPERSRRSVAAVVLEIELRALDDGREHLLEDLSARVGDAHNDRADEVTRQRPAGAGQHERRGHRPGAQTHEQASNQFSRAQDRLDRSGSGVHPDQIDVPGVRRCAFHHRDE